MRAFLILFIILGSTKSYCQSYDELFEKGKEDRNEYHYQSAIQIFTDLIKQYPNKPDAYFERGYTKVILKDYRGAAADFSRAIDLAPKVANIDDNKQLCEAYKYRSYAKNKFEDHKGAAADLSKSVELELVFKYIIDGLREGVFSLFSEDDKKKATAHNLKAIAAYSKAIDLDPKNRRAYNYRGTEKMDLKDFRGAITDFSKAIEIDPMDAESYTDRGKSKIELKDYKGALTDFSKAIELDPKNVNAYFLRGKCKLTLNDKNGACLDFSKAGELGSEEAYEIIKAKCNN
jgi:tetratricopeptide (TPR) repeat protein